MSKNATIRLPEDVQNKLKTDFGGLQSAISLIVEPFERLRKMTVAELKGYFSPEEMTAIIDSQNGVLLTPDFVYNKAFFIAQIEDFETFESGISRHGAVPEDLIRKLSSISHSQVYYLMLDIRIMWTTQQPIEIYLKDWL